MRSLAEAHANLAAAMRDMDECVDRLTSPKKTYRPDVIIVSIPKGLSFDEKLKLGIRLSEVAGGGIVTINPSFTSNR